MRLKYWAFLIVLAAELILFFLAFYVQESRSAQACFGLGVFLSLFLFVALVDILVEAIKKRRAYRSLVIWLVVSLGLFSLGILLFNYGL